ncbi:hypothetical protein [Butyrivibrio sp. LB2008]|uniref:hypothetical protein n=1 Tax=Butyrivibrio sp. LB2008 TaxID=1408305 RepID=UPI0012DE2C16|nr:hypothetical protein [Butyrivibrio sp. LB2008]
MKNTRKEIENNFIYFILAIWLASEVLFSSTITRIIVWETEYVNDFMDWFVLILLVIQIVFFQRYQTKELVYIAIVTIPIVIATISSSHNVMMSTWIFIVAAKYIDFDKLIKIAYVVQIIMVAIVLYLFFSGVIDEYTMYRGAILRHSLGFGHPNRLGIRVLQLIVCRCYLRRKKLGISDILIILAAAIFVNRVANSKTAYYSLLVFAVMITVRVISNMMNIGIERYISYTIYMAGAVNVLSIVLTFIDIKKYPFLKRIDKAMSIRFSTGHETLKHYGVSVWGQDIQSIVKRHVIGRIYHFWLDNAYMSILLRYGVVVFLIFSSLYISTMLYLKKQKQYMLLEIMCLFAIYGVMENNFSMSRNIFLLLFSYPIFRRELKQENVIPSRIRITI